MQFLYIIRRVALIAILGAVDGAWSFKKGFFRGLSNLSAAFSGCDTSRECCEAQGRKKQEELFLKSQDMMNSARAKGTHDSQPECEAIYKRIEYNSYKAFVSQRRTNRDEPTLNCGFVTLHKVFRSGERAEGMRALFHVIAGIDAISTPNIAERGSLDQMTHEFNPFGIVQQAAQNLGLAELISYDEWFTYTLARAWKVFDAVNELENNDEDRGLVLAYAAHVASQARIIGAGIKTCKERLPN